MLGVMGYVHHIPGRIRLRAVALKGNSADANVLTRWLESLSGVEDVEVNLLTGSVLIHYRPEVTNGSDLIAKCRARLGPSAGARTRTAQPGELGSAFPKDLQRKVAKVAAGYVAQVVIERSLAALVAAIF